VQEGALVACDIVWAETAAHFSEAGVFHEAMDRLGIGYSFLPEIAAVAAAQVRRHAKPVPLAL